MRAHCSGVLPGPNTASGMPWRSARWWSTRAPPTSAKGSRRSRATTSSAADPPGDEVVEHRPQRRFLHAAMLPNTGVPRPTGRVVALAAMASRPISRVGFFGPFGTFTEQAVRTQADLAAAELVDFVTVPDVLDAVESGDVDCGVVPIENSIEGVVNLTQDALAFDYDLLITREIVLDIEHCLVGAAGLTLDEVKAVVSFPVATAQCHRFLREHLRGVEVRTAQSTASAAKLVAEGDGSGAARARPRRHRPAGRRRALRAWP